MPAVSATPEAASNAAAGGTPSKTSVSAIAATPAAAARVAAVQGICTRTGRRIEFPKSTQSSEDTPAPVSEIFGEQVFGFAELRKSLPRPVFASLVQQMAGHGHLDRATADAVAHAVKMWAIERGATHYTHWFQPLTNAAAEKHDSFLSIKYSQEGGCMRAEALDAFSGAQLVQAEPDASSFPNGGARTTFEARGYTVWDTTSPMFLMDAPHGTRVLHIPSIFISYNGEALDEKTILLRSCAAVSDATLDVLRLLGADDGASHVHTTLGTEQEFFLIDRALYALRPDLRLAGRTLVGRVPAKHQEMEDHYFGQMPSRVLAALSETELELWRLGVPVKTRHNEVAPNQFEMAPVYEEASVAVDHNLLTMAVLRKVAHRHGLKVLFHEKPFGGVNGSGKHCNWSLATDTGRNLLEPGETPSENVPFLAVLCGVLLGLSRHGGLLGAAIASSSNEHRLGANEAPPAVISAFLGEQLSAVMEALAEGRPVAQRTVTKKRVMVGSRGIDVHIAHLPSIARDATDRNRTSPFAFTGDKFEFRAVGASQSPSFPVSMLNAATASALRDIAARLRRHAGANGAVSRDKAMAVLAEVARETKAVRFDGDGYSGAWREEAARRGLPNLVAAPDAFAQLLAPHNMSMLLELDVFNDAELGSRFNIVCERYTKELLIEGRLSVDIARTQVLPAALRSRAALLAQSTGSSYEERMAQRMATHVGSLGDAIDAAEEAVRETEDAMHSGSHEASAETSGLLSAARLANSRIRAALSRLRAAADALEADMPDDQYPFPKYSELLFC